MFLLSQFHLQLFTLIIKPEFYTRELFICDTPLNYSSFISLISLSSVKILHQKFWIDDDLGLSEIYAKYISRFMENFLMKMMP